MLMIYVQTNTQTMQMKSMHYVHKGTSRQLLFNVVIEKLFQILSKLWSSFNVPVQGIA